MTGSPTRASIGADAAALETVAAAFRSAARTLAGLAGAERSLRRSGWSGPDAEQAVRSSVRADRACVEVADALLRSAGRLDEAARRQRTASLPIAASPVITVESSTRTDGGRLVQRVGRADAPLVVVVVPGVGSDPGDGVRLRADAVRLWWELTEEVDDPSAVAVVSWLGYDPPDNIVGAVDAGPADRGAAALVEAGRRARVAGAERIAVVGHSYGALVAGRAAARGMDADLLVQLGAPGVGVPGGTATIRRLGTAHVAARERDDPIAWVAPLAGRIYGEDPVGRVPTLPTSLRGHGAYLRDPVLLSALADRAVGVGPWTAQPVPSRRWASPWTPQTASPRS